MPGIRKQIRQKSNRTKPNPSVNKSPYFKYYKSSDDDNRYYAIAINKDQYYIGGGGFGSVYRAYEYLYENGELQFNNDKELVAKIERNSFNKVYKINKITSQFYETSAPFKWSNDEHISFTEKLGDADLGQIANKIDPAIHSKQAVRQHYNIDKLPNQLYTVMQILTQLSEMHALTDHNQPTIHNDIKPDNIIMSTNGPSITDFGLSVYTDSFGSPNYLKGTRGNPYYTPPELRADEHGFSCISPKGDIYSMVRVILTVLQDGKHYKPSRTASFDTNVLQIDSTWNDDSFDFRQNLIDFLERMQAKMMSKRPDCDEALRYFQLAHQYTQIKESLEKTNQPTLEQKQQLNATKAKMILLSKGAWHLPIWRNGQLRTWEEHDFSYDDPIWDKILESPKDITPARLTTYLTFQQFELGHCRNCSINKPLGNSESPITGLLYETIASLARILQNSANDPQNLQFTINAVYDNYNPVQLKTISQLYKANASEDRLTQVVADIFKDVYSDDQLETVHALLNNGYDVDEHILDIILPQDTPPTLNSHLLQYIKSSAENHANYRLPEIIKHILPYKDKLNAYVAVNKTCEKPQLFSDMFYYLINDDDVSYTARQLITQKYLNKASNPDEYSKLLTSLTNLEHLWSEDNTVSHACRHLISYYKDNEVLDDIIHTLAAFEPSLSKEDYYGEHYRQILADYSDQPQTLSSIIMTLNNLHDYIENPECLLQQSNFDPSQYSNIQQQLLMLPSSTKQQLQQHFPNQFEALRSNTLSGLTQAVKSTSNPELIATINEQLREQLTEQLYDLDQQSQTQIGCFGFFSTKNSAREQASAIRELLEKTQQRTPRSDNISPSSHNNPDDISAQSDDNTSSQPTYSKRVNRLINNADPIISKTVLTLLRAHSELYKTAAPIPEASDDHNKNDEDKKRPSLS